jgi:hypothetical protein
LRPSSRVFNAIDRKGTIEQEQRIVIGGGPKGRHIMELSWEMTKLNLQVIDHISWLVISEEKV